MKRKLRLHWEQVLTHARAYGQPKNNESEMVIYMTSTVDCKARVRNGPIERERKTAHTHNSQCIEC